MKSVAAFTLGLLLGYAIRVSVEPYNPCSRIHPTYVEVTGLGFGNDVQAMTEYSNDLKRKCEER